MTTMWESIQVDGNPMRLYISVPDGPGPFPAVVVIQHQFGVDEFVEEMADRLSSAGYFAVAPDLYHRDGPDCQDDGPTRRGRLRDGGVIPDVNAAVDFAKAHRLVDSDKLGIIGFCMGGRVAYLMAAVSPSLKAAVIYYAGHVFDSWGEGPTCFERSAEIHCPVLGHFGDEDKDPSPEHKKKLAAELSRHGKLHEFHSYSKAGHAFMNRRSKAYRAHADEESWPRTLGFLGRYLG